MVVNNIDDPCLYMKINIMIKGDRSFVDITLKGSEKNINAIGAKIIVFANGQVRTYENYPVRGFQSSMEIPIHIGLDKTNVDSMFLIWPDNSYQPVSLDDTRSSQFYLYKRSPNV